MAFLAAVLGGLILNVMPCVFPILSLKAIGLARTGASAEAARHEALAYTAGVVSVCIALGAALIALRASGAAFGWAFQLQNPYVVGGLAVLFVALALNLAGLYELPTPAFAGRAGQVGAFATGALAAFVATPARGRSWVRHSAPRSCCPRPPRCSCSQASASGSRCRSSRSAMCRRCATDSPPRPLDGHAAPHPCCADVPYRACAALGTRASGRRERHDSGIGDHDWCSAGVAMGRHTAKRIILVPLRHGRASSQSARSLTLEPSRFSISDRQFREKVFGNIFRKTAPSLQARAACRHRPSQQTFLSDDLAGGP